jgi:hypothetical protein
MGTSGASALRDGVLLPKSSGSTQWVYGFLSSLLPTDIWTDSVVWQNTAIYAGEPWLGVSAVAGVTALKLGVMPWDSFISQTSTVADFITTADGNSWQNIVSSSNASDGTGYTYLAWWLLLP